jgi:HK97 family phage major capsid protein
VRTIQEIKGDIARLEKEYQELHAKRDGDLTGTSLEEAARKLDTDLEALERELRLAEAQAKASRIETVAPAPVEIAYAEQKDAVKDDGSRELKEFLSGQGGERKTMSLGTDASGGAASATAQFVAELFAVAAKGSFALQSCSVYTVDAAKAAEIPVLTAERAQAGWVAESTNDTGSDPGFARRTITLYSARATTGLTRQLLEQSAIPIEQEIAAQLGRSIAYLIDSFVVGGTGTSQPLGVGPDNANGVPAAQKVTGGSIATTVSYDNLVDTLFKLRPPYWANATWLLSPGTLAAIRKLKDSSNRPLIDAAVTIGAVPSLLGRPYIVSEFVSAPSANAVVALVGDWSKYAIARGGEVTLIVDPYSQALKAEIWYHAFQMLGGWPGVGEAFAKLVCPAT